jgi:hypothetical protein
MHRQRRAPKTATLTRAAQADLATLGSWVVFGLARTGMLSSKTETVGQQSPRLLVDRKLPLEIGSRRPDDIGSMP